MTNSRRDRDLGGTPFGIRRTNGHKPEGVDTRSVPFEDIEGPPDLVAVQADDELLNALAAGAPVPVTGRPGHDADDRVAAMLAAWKAEVDAEPIPELVDLDTAVDTVIRAAARKRSRRTRHLVPLAGAAALIVLATGGVSVGAQHATPGDALFPITKVLYQEQARSAEAVVTIEEANSKARELLAVGDVQGAEHELVIAKQAVADVQPDHGRDQLARETEFLAAKAEETPPGTPADLSTPPSTRPDPRVHPGRPAPEKPTSAPTTADPSRGDVSTLQGGSTTPQQTTVSPTPAPPSGATGGPAEPTPPPATSGGGPTPTTAPPPAGSTPGTASGPAGASSAASSPAS